MGIVLRFIKRCHRCDHKPLIYTVNSQVFVTCSNESCEKIYKTKGHKTKRGAIGAWNRGKTVPYFQ